MDFKARGAKTKGKADSSGASSKFKRGSESNHKDKGAFIPDTAKEKDAQTREKENRDFDR